MMMGEGAEPLANPYPSPIITLLRVHLALARKSLHSGCASAPPGGRERSNERLRGSRASDVFKLRCMTLPHPIVT
jgi:hypothetical protein